MDECLTTGPRQSASRRRSKTRCSGPCPDGRGRSGRRGSRRSRRGVGTVDLVRREGVAQCQHHCCVAIEDHVETFRRHSSPSRTSRQSTSTPIPAALKAARVAFDASSCELWLMKTESIGRRADPLTAGRRERESPHIHSAAPQSSTEASARWLAPPPWSSCAQALVLRAGASKRLWPTGARSSGSGRRPSRQRPVDRDGVAVEHARFRDLAVDAAADQPCGQPRREVIEPVRVEPTTSSRACRRSASRDRGCGVTSASTRARRSHRADGRVDHIGLSACTRPIGPGPQPCAAQARAPPPGTLAVSAWTPGDRQPDTFYLSRYDASREHSLRRRCNSASRPVNERPSRPPARTRDRPRSASSRDLCSGYGTRQSSASSSP